MKHIGIAAITAEGAALVYRNICRMAALRLGEYCHPEISLHSFSFSQHVHANEDRLSVCADLILESSHKLKACGADFMICPANSTHEVYKLVEKSLPIPWLHIADGVILGCTELPLILPDACPDVPVLDSTLALADAAVNAAIDG